MRRIQGSSKSRMRLAFGAMVVLAPVLTAPGCLPAAGHKEAQGPEPAGKPLLTDQTRAAGLSWVHNPCRSGRKFLPETMGGGGGFLDYDGDGLLDIILLNGAPLPGYSGARPSHALYRNQGDGSFADATNASGLAGLGYGMGAAAADYDGDGRVDLYVTGVNSSRLYRNTGKGFEEVTRASGIQVDGWGTGAAWLDYDRDGHLDLFVARYVKWAPGLDPPCGAGEKPQYCPPFNYQPLPPHLFRNVGDGKFEDVSAKTGILGHSGKTLSVMVLDANGDAWPDLFLANDTEPDVLLVNNSGRFTNQAVPAGIAVGLDGSATGSMGVDAGTLSLDGRLSLAVGTFVGQGLSLFQKISGTPSELLFDNARNELALGDPTLSMSTFGLAFSDLDADGWTDILAVNGNLDEGLVYGRAEAYRQLPQLFQNRGGQAFRDVAAAAGLTEPIVGRGLAVGDYDNDGRQDFLILENGGPARLCRNETAMAGDWLGVQLAGKAGMDGGLSATITLSGSGWQQTRFVTTSRSYLTTHDPRAHFGVGRRKAETLTVRWPDGTVSELKNPQPNQYLTVRQ